MNGWIAHLKLELAALFRYKSVWAIPLLYGFWLRYDMAGISPDIAQDTYYHAVRFHEINHSLSLGIALLLGITLLRRDLLRPSFEWSGSLPISGFTLITTKYAVGMLYLSAYTAAMALAYGTAAANASVPWHAVWRHIGTFAIQYELSYAVTLALGMTLGMWIKHRITYLIGFCAWMFGTFFIDIFLINGLSLYALKTFHLNQFVMDGMLENEGWGEILLNEEMRWSRPFVAMFTVLLLVVVAIGFHYRRLSSGRVRAIALGCGVLAACAALYWPYGQMWAQRYASLHAMQANPMSDYAYIHEHSRTFPVERYDIRVVIGERDRLAIEAAVTIDPDQAPANKQWTFLLNPDFTLTDVRADGVPVEFVRRGAQVIAEPPSHPVGSDPVELAFAYEGELSDWGYEYSAETMHSFVVGEEVLLQDSSAWYPLPDENGMYAIHGDGSLFRRRNAGPLEPYDIRIEVEGAGREWYGNVPLIERRNGVYVYESEQASDVKLFGSSWWNEYRLPGESLRIVTSPSNALEAKRFLTDVAEAKQYYESWLGPLDQVNTILYVPMFSSDYELSRYQDVRGGTYVIAGSEHHNLDRYQRDNAMEAILFGDLSGASYFSEADPDAEGYSVAGEIRQLIHYMLAVEKRELFANFGGYAPPSTEEARRMFGQAEQLIREERIDKLKAVLREFHQRGLTIDWEKRLIPIYTMSDWMDAWERHAGHQHLNM